MRLYFDKILDVKNFYDKTAKFYDLVHHVQTLWADNIHRIAVIKAANFTDGDTVLDIGTGTSLAAILAINKTFPQIKIRVIGVDISTQMLLKARRNLKKFNVKERIFNINCDARNLPLRNSLINIIISVYGIGGVKTRLKELFIGFLSVAKKNVNFSFGEMTAPPYEKGLFRRKFHELLVEPFINLIWQFKDVNLTAYFKKFGIKIIKKKYYDNKYFGSMTLLAGNLIRD